MTRSAVPRVRTALLTESKFSSVEGVEKRTSVEDPPFSSAWTSIATTRPGEVQDSGRAECRK